MRQFAAMAVLVLCGPCLGETWTVDDDGPADFDNTQAAVDASLDGDEIIEFPGTCTSTQDSHVFDMKEMAITLRSSKGTAVTAIDGQSERRGVACFRGEASSTIIEGFTMTDGYAVWFDHSPSEPHESL